MSGKRMQNWEKDRIQVMNDSNSFSDHGIGTGFDFRANSFHPCMEKMKVSQKFLCGVFFEGLEFDRMDDCES